MENLTERKEGKENKQEADLSVFRSAEILHEDEKRLVVQRDTLMQKLHDIKGALKQVKAEQSAAQLLTVLLSKPMHVYWYEADAEVVRLVLDREQRLSTHGVLVKGQGTKMFSYLWIVGATDRDGLDQIVWEDAEEPDWPEEDEECGCGKPKRCHIYQVTYKGRPLPSSMTQHECFSRDAENYRFGRSWDYGEYQHMHAIVQGLVGIAHKETWRHILAE